MVLKVEVARVGGGVGHTWWEPSGWWGLRSALSYGDWSKQLSVSHDICLWIYPSRRTGSLWLSLLLAALPPNPSDWALNFNVMSWWGHSDSMYGRWSVTSSLGPHSEAAIGQPAGNSQPSSLVCFEGVKHLWDQKRHRSLAFCGFV